MKRTKEWWAALTKDERSHLVYIERHANESTGYGGGGYLPDDCGECPACGQPVFGSSSLCSYCSNSLEKYLDKADKSVKNLERS